MPEVTWQLLSSGETHLLFVNYPIIYCLVTTTAGRQGNHTRFSVCCYFWVILDSLIKGFHLLRFP